MSGENPILSIVIANYNYGRFLGECIESVIRQEGFDRCELIICDAASSDNSLEVIHDYENYLSWWCSEKDGGQSAAFNKGFRHARGRYLTWLNADDILEAGCLTRICSELENHPDVLWFTGNFFRFDGKGKILQIGWGPRVYPQFLQKPCSPVVAFGPTSFFSKELLERMGWVDERLHYIMDTDLWIRFMCAGVKQRRVPCLCWGFRMHEESKTAEFADHSVSRDVAMKMKAENEYVLQKTGYRMSKLLHICILLWRVLDGSAFQWVWLALTRRTIRIDGVVR